MNRYILLLNCLLLCSKQLCSQHVADIAKENPILKISLLPVYHIDNAFVLATEIPLSKGRFSLQPEIGYGWGAGNLLYKIWAYGDSPPDKNTFRSKLQFRSYYKSGSAFRAYYGGEYSYRHMNYRQPGPDAGGTSVVTPPLHLRRTTHGMYGILGWQRHSGSRFSVDFYMGFGLQMSKNFAVTKGLTGEELSEIRFDEMNWFRRSKRIGRYGPYPDFLGAIQLGFILGKFNR